jgi:hypothetical protein
VRGIALGRRNWTFAGSERGAERVAVMLTLITTSRRNDVDKDVSRRYRRPLDHIVHWNHFDKSKLRPDIMIDHYVKEVRPFAMYRGLENVHDWEDADEILGEYKRFY